MGYAHIDNLYRNREIMIFREVFALEKIHGTSAYVAWRDNGLSFSSGGETHDRFVGLFDQAQLRERFALLGENARVTVYGEAYGGKQQGMKKLYGEQLRFITFDVNFDGHWLSVPDACILVHALGLEFVHYESGPATVEWIDAQRDAPSVQAVRNGVGEGLPREGVVLRPPIEVTKNNGERICAKHKAEAYKEMTTHRPLGNDPVVLTAADEIANEWVTEMRLSHVLGALQAKHGQEMGLQNMRLVLDAMVEDVQREAKGEIVESVAGRRAISQRTSKMFKARVTRVPA